MTNVIILFVSLISAACFQHVQRGSFTAESSDHSLNVPISGATDYRWSRVTPSAEFPTGYNYPVFVLGDKMIALNNGAWISQNGKNWQKTELPDVGLNSAYQHYVQFNGAVYALGALSGNYEKFTISTTIRRTADFNKWETVAETSNLPKRIFYAATVFDNKIWMFGGYDGRNYYNDVWNSTDGVNWRRVAESVAWSRRNPGEIVQFKDRLWMFGGGVIDGEKASNPNSGKEIWSSADAIHWKLEKVRTDCGGGTPVVFDGRLWFVGANRNDGVFGNAVAVSDNALDYQMQSAPWSPRGGVAAWVFRGRLFMTGGKFSHVENGAIKFVYSNDVWTMSRQGEEAGQ